MPAILWFIEVLLVWLLVRVFDWLGDDNRDENRREARYRIKSDVLD